MVLTVMSLNEILPSVRELSAADKRHLIRLLTEEVAADPGLALREQARTYVLSTPVFEPGAAQALREELNTGSSFPS